MELCLARVAVRRQNLTGEGEKEKKAVIELGQAKASLGPPLSAIIRAAGGGFPCGTAQTSSDSTDGSARVHH
jgi:hypothetical protein